MRLVQYLAVAAVLVPAHAYAVSATCPAAGVVAQMSDGTRFEFQGADRDDQDVCVWRTIDGNGTTQESRFVFAIHNVNNQMIAAAEMRQMLEALFKPSSQGIVSAVLDNGGWNSSMRTVLTTSDDIVTVPAGTFQAVVIKLEAKGVFGNERKQTATYYLDRNTHVPVLIDETLDGNRFVLRAVKLTAPGH